jgi:hypothetical protein
MCRKIAVAQPEPGLLDAVRLQLRLRIPGFVDPTPTAHRVDPAGQCVHDRVEVRADAQPMQGDVVRRVGDHGDGVRWRDGIEDALGEP